MSREVWSDDRLAELAALPPEHPDVRAVAADPERMARLLALRAFLYPSPEPTGTRTDEAVARLRAAVRDALGDTDGAAHSAAASPRRGVARTRREPEGRGWWFGGWRSALAAAAVVLVAVMLVYPRLGGREPVMRGSAEAGIETLAPLATADHVFFQWRAVPDADLYELRLLRADLAPSRPVFATTDTVAQVPMSELLPPGAAAGAAAFWRVTALRGGVPIAQSELIALEPPRPRPR